MFTTTTLAAFLRRTLPAIDQHDFAVEAAALNGARLRFPFRPALLSFADTAIYAAAQALLGEDSIAVVATMNLAFLSPAKAADVVATARIVRPGKRLLHAEAELANAGAAPVLKASAALSTLQKRL